MGRFQGSVAENLTAEAMIHGWEAICKLWQASSVLNGRVSVDPAGEGADSLDDNAQQVGTSGVAHLMDPCHTV